MRHADDEAEAEGVHGLLAGISQRLYGSNHGVVGSR